MTIAQTIISDVENNGGKFITMSSLWDYHNCGSIGKPGSNVHTALKKAFDDNPAIQKIWVKSGAKGRTQHSRTEMLIFDVTNMEAGQRNNADIDSTGKLFNRYEIVK